jgi:hypothetical protein
MKSLSMKVLVALLAVLALSVSTASAFSPRGVPHLQLAGHGASFVAKLAPRSIVSRGLRRQVVAQVGEEPSRRLLGQSFARDDRQPRGQKRVVARVERQPDGSDTSQVREMTAPLPALQSLTIGLVLQIVAVLITTATAINMQLVKPLVESSEVRIRVEMRSNSDATIAALNEIKFDLKGIRLDRDAIHRVDLVEQHIADLFPGK